MFQKNTKYMLRDMSLPCPSLKWKTLQQKEQKQIRKHDLLLSVKHWWKQIYLISYPLTWVPNEPNAPVSKEKSGSMSYRYQGLTMVLRTFSSWREKEYYQNDYSAYLWMSEARAKELYPTKGGSTLQSYWSSLVFPSAFNVLSVLLWNQMEKMKTLVFSYRIVTCVLLSRKA